MEKKGGEEAIIAPIKEDIDAINRYTKYPKTPNAFFVDKSGARWRNLVYPVDRWYAFLKYDGTNVRILYTEIDGLPVMYVWGRSDRAQLPAAFTSCITSRYYMFVQKMWEQVAGREHKYLLLYGEGVGGLRPCIKRVRFSKVDEQYSEFPAVKLFSYRVLTVSNAEILDDRWVVGFRAFKDFIQFATVLPDGINSIAQFMGIHTIDSAFKTVKALSNIQSRVYEGMVLWNTKEADDIIVPRKHAVFVDGKRFDLPNLKIKVRDVVRLK